MTVDVDFSEAVILKVTCRLIDSSCDVNLYMLDKSLQPTLYGHALLACGNETYIVCVCVCMALWYYSLYTSAFNKYNNVTSICIQSHSEKLDVSF